MVAMLAWTLFCVLLATLRAKTPLVVAMIIAGLVQAPLVIVTQDLAFQWIDDVAAVLLIMGAFFFAVGRGGVQAQRATLLLVGIGVVAAIGIMRSPDLGVGIAQGRQVLIPIGLAYAGFVYYERVNWMKVFRITALLAVIFSAWMIWEEILQKPLMDATWYYLEAVGGTPEKLRGGIPPSYYADGIGGETIFRPGGSMMNPPAAGMFLGAGAFALLYSTRGVVRYGGLLLVGISLFFSFARAGIVIFLCVTILFWVWRRLGRFSGVVVSVLAAAYLVQSFLEQGATATHFNGLLNGVTLGITSVIGAGFGSFGYQAVLEDMGNGAVGESLLGLWVAWLGIPLLAFIVWYAVLLVQRMIAVPRDRSLLYWLALGMVATVAGTETASSLAAGSLLWMCVGLALRRGDEIPQRIEPKYRPDRRVKSNAITIAGVRG